MDPNLTVLLQSWQAGDTDAIEAAFPHLYALLRTKAAAIYAGNPTPTLQPTALVHEAFMRLHGQDRRWENRDHFLAVAAVVMRRILVDAARARRAEKRGSGAIHLQIDEALTSVEAKGVDLLVLDEALNLLREMDPRQAQIVELRFFSGLSVAEVATVLQTSDKTVQRGWSLARAWLQKYLESH